MVLQEGTREGEIALANEEDAMAGFEGDCGSLLNFLILFCRSWGRSSDLSRSFIRLGRHFGELSLFGFSHHQM